MSATILTWRTVTPFNDPKYMVKGHVLSSALYGPQSRFLIEEVRALTIDRGQTAIYRVRDADGVTDAEMRDGKGSPIVHWTGTPDDAIAWCDGVLGE